MDILLKFSESLSALIQENNLKPEQIAADICQNIYDIYHWQSSKNKFMPSISSLVKLANYFNCSIEFLIGIESENSLPKPKPAANFCQRFPLVVKEKGYNFFKLAKATQMNNASYYAWIKGKAEPRIDSLIRISNVLDCSIDYLLGREN